MGRRAGAKCCGVVLTLLLVAEPSAAFWRRPATENTASDNTASAAEHGCVDGCDGAAASRRPWVEQLAWKPRAYLYHNFLTDEEADHIIALASPRIRASSVIHANGTVGDDPIRTSWGTFLSRAEDEVVRRIEERVAHWTHLPPENAEDMQVLRYQNGQKYGAHWDELDPYKGQRTVSGGRSYRVATVLIYLSTPDVGGETAFPRGIWMDKEVQLQAAGKEFSECGSEGVGVHARKGDALLFWGMQPSGDTLDRYSMHTGCPVLEGTKWSATKWIHGEPFGWSPYHRPKTSAQEEEERQVRQAAEERRRRRREQEAADPCRDLSEFCADWAFEGECEKNVAFMRSQCQKSCGYCCLEGDVLCERKLARLEQQEEQQQQQKVDAGHAAAAR